MLITKDSNGRGLRQSQADSEAGTEQEIDREQKKSI